MRTTEERLRAARKRARALDRARKNRRITALCGGGSLAILAALALCLTPFLQALCHLLVFRLLALLAGSYAEGGVKTMLEAVSGAYGMLLGILGACCALQFITIVVSLTVIRT